MKDGEIPHNLMKFIGQGRNVTDNGKICDFFSFNVKVRSEHTITFLGKKIEPGRI